MDVMDRARPVMRLRQLRIQSQRVDRLATRQRRQNPLHISTKRNVVCVLLQEGVVFYLPRVRRRRRASRACSAWV